MIVLTLEQIESIKDAARAMYMWPNSFNGLLAQFMENRYDDTIFNPITSENHSQALRQFVGLVIDHKEEFVSVPGHNRIFSFDAGDERSLRWAIVDAAAYHHRSKRRD